VDEADKAPLEVICILKGLVEDGEMMLSDGRRILSQERLHEAIQGTRVIPIASGFRVVMLANKQGYPFLGNDLLNELGDCFSWYVFLVHATHNGLHYRSNKLLCLMVVQFGGR
jgi:von Willebrand factor A domain-containing protein 8